MIIHKPGKTIDKDFICSNCGCEFSASIKEYRKGFMILNPVNPGNSKPILVDSFQCQCPWCTYIVEIERDVEE